MTYLVGNNFNFFITRNKKVPKSTLLEKELRQKSAKKHSFRKRVAAEKCKKALF